MDSLKDEVRSFWEAEPCGTRYGASAERTQYFSEIEEARYRLEPYIPPFARFADGKGARVLEIGVGAGTDFVQWVRAGAHAVGVDLTQASARLAGENATLRAGTAAGRTLTADAEALPFPDGYFDLVYSWGVLHHSPDTPAALAEVVRVLRPGGTLRVMVYHVPSWSGWMLWVQHGLLRGRPWRSVAEILSRHYESPGTKAYGVEDFRGLLTQAGVDVLGLETHLSTSDLLLQQRSGRYASPLFGAIWKLYPRWLVRALGHRYGTVLMADGRKAGVDGS